VVCYLLLICFLSVRKLVCGAYVE